jgi:DNA-binding MarR family transcriptional regulator
MAELAQCLDVEKAALTGLVDRVERRGLVVRSPVPDDRRALCVTLTAAGRRAATAFHAAATKELDHLLEPLTCRARDQLRDAIVDIVGADGGPST